MTWAKFSRRLDEYHKKRKRENLQNADDSGWTKHTEYHWSRMLNGKRLDYWPSTTRFQYDGKVMTGGIEGFIKNRLAKDEDK